MRAGSGCGSVRARGKRQLLLAWKEQGWQWLSCCPVPPPHRPMGGAEMGPRGFCGSPGWELERVQPECRVSSWLGASSLSSGWPASPSPAHRALGTTPPPMRGWGVGGGRQPCPRTSAGGGPGTSPRPPAAEGQDPRGAPGSVRAPISPLHLEGESGVGALQQKAASSPAQWLLSRPGCSNKGPFVGARVPGGRALASSPLRWAPASPPPSRGVPPASPTPMGERGWAASGARHFGKRGVRGGGRASSAVTGARLGMPGCRWGALLRGPGVLPARGGSVLAAATANSAPRPGSSLCHREVGRCGSGVGGHAGSAAGLSLSGDAKVACWHLAIPQSRRKSIGKEGVGFPGNLCFTPARDPLAELHLQQRSCVVPGAPGFAFRQNHAWIYGWVQHPKGREGTGHVLGHACGCSVGWRVLDPTCAGRAGCSHPGHEDPKSHPATHEGSGALQGAAGAPLQGGGLRFFSGITTGFLEVGLLASGELEDGKGAASRLLPVLGRAGSCLRALPAPKQAASRAPAQAAPDAWVCRPWGLLLQLACPTGWPWSSRLLASSPWSMSHWLSPSSQDGSWDTLCMNLI